MSAERAIQVESGGCKTPAPYFGFLSNAVMALQVFWPQASFLGDPRHKSRTDLFIVVESKGVIRPTGAAQPTMRSVLPRHVHPIRTNAAKSLFAFTDGQRLMR